MNTLAADWADRPKPQPDFLFAPPPSAPLVTSDLLEAVHLDITERTRGVFWSRMYDEDCTPPSAQIIAVYIFYGIGLSDLVARLQYRWKALGTGPSKTIRYARHQGYGRFAHYLAFRHVGEPSRLVQTIEALHRRFAA